MIMISFPSSSIVLSSEKYLHITHCIILVQTHAGAKAKTILSASQIVFKKLYVFALFGSSTKIDTDSLTMSGGI